MSRARWLPRRSDAYAVCERVAGRCACRETTTGPCDAWRPYLHICHQLGLDPVAAEGERIGHNIQCNTLFTVPCIFTHPRDERERT